MPNIASAKKRERQNIVRRARNRSRLSRLRGSLRKLDEAIAGGDTAAVQSSWNDAQSLLDQSASLGVIHRNVAARKKSRMLRRIAAMAS